MITLGNLLDHKGENLLTKHTFALVVQAHYLLRASMHASPSAHLDHAGDIALSIFESCND